MAWSFRGATKAVAPLNARKRQANRNILATWQEQRCKIAGSAENRRGSPCGGRSAGIVGEKRSALGLRRSAMRKTR
eukprot:scaffold7020_cov210-Pinguiococcus_pyrenoidosus.AAC.1